MLDMTVLAEDIVLAYSRHECNRPGHHMTYEVSCPAQRSPLPTADNLAANLPVLLSSPSVSRLGKLSIGASISMGVVI